MGICHNCYQQSSASQIDGIKTLNAKAGQQFNGIKFTFTNKPLSDLKADCLVFYADHGNQLYPDQFMKKISRKLRRKILQYLDYVELNMANKSMRHSLSSINIPSFDFKNLILAKLQPWDGHSVQEIKQKIYDLTIGYLETINAKKIKTLVITQFDPFSGIHYSISCYPIFKAIQNCPSNLRNVTILCDSKQSLEYYHKHIKNSKNPPIKSKISKVKKKTLAQEIIFYENQ